MTVKIDVQIDCINIFLVKNDKQFFVRSFDIFEGREARTFVENLKNFVN